MSTFFQNENTIARDIVSCAYKIHNELGPGLLESFYEAVLAHELVKMGHSVVRQQGITVWYDGIKFDEGFRADMTVDDLVLVEIKSVEAIHPVHPKQLLTYLKLTNKRLGLLINFNEVLIKDGLKRLLNGL